MTMKPPALADALVNGFSVSPAIANEILGDLAEEWPERLDRHGPRRAARWYWGQTVRAIPHLLRQWGRESSWTTIVGCLIAAVLMRMLVAFVVNRAVGAIDLNALPNGTLFVVALVARLATDVGFAVLVAQVFRQTPLIYVTIVWLAYLVMQLWVFSTHRDHPTQSMAMGITEWGLVSILVWLPLTLAGALFVIRTRERARPIA
jgi:hypothetical protein